MNISSSLLQEIKSIILNAKEKAVRAVDNNRVLMYWHIGKVIFEEEQQGKDRSDYGSYLIKYLSAQLQPEFGESFSFRNLNLFRQFYRSFPIVNTLRSQFTWTHYRMLIRIENEDKREYYISETTKNNWTSRQLERQINSQLFERLLLSNDKESVLAVARGEKQPSEAREIIKDPMVLEFLGLKREAAYYEKDLEAAIITHLQDFMLESGNGFAFIARKSVSILKEMISLLTLFSITVFCNALLSSKSKRMNSFTRISGSYRCMLTIMTVMKDYRMRTPALVFFFVPIKQCGC